MSQEIIELLRQIRDRQRDALGLQQKQIDLYMKQLERAERINDRAEAIQLRSGRAIKIVLWVALPLLLVLFVVMFRRYL